MPRHKEIKDLLGKVTRLANPNIRIITIPSDKPDKIVLDKILWFVFSQSKELHLSLQNQRKIAVADHKSINIVEKIKLVLTRKRLFWGFIFILVLYHLLFISTLLGTSFMLLKGAKNAKNEELVKSESQVQFAEFLLSVSQRLYYPIRPVYLFFSLAFPFDNLIEINDKSKIVLEQYSLIHKNAKDVAGLVLKKEKTTQEKLLLNLRVARLYDSLDLIEDNLTILSQKIPEVPAFSKKIKQDVSTLLGILTKSKKFFSNIDSLLAKNSRRNYLLLFANNKELRPGGGFIGSFGTATFEDMTLTQIRVYDVYDADGQLIAHVEPPEPIKKYLSQPHWFLRDSAFSPDFLENYAQAKFFLDKEMSLGNFDGAVLLTTSALENIFSAFGDIFVPDFNEKVNSKNFYLKAQLYAQSDFFPGSIQKKSFLSSVTRQLLINLDSVSPKKLALQLKKSLDEKQIVVYFDDPKIEKFFDSLYWSGRLIQQSCPQDFPNCISDYLYPIDANLGVNKANFFMTRSMNLRIRIDEQGVIHHAFVIKFKNDAPNEVFPGGLYHNYFQVLLPQKARLIGAQRDGILIDDVKETDGALKTVGFIIDVPPKKSVEIKIDYDLEPSYKTGRNTFQLILQKQIGSSNSDFILEFIYPQNIKVIKQNFSSLVKNNHIFYNTSLSADKIFFIELVKN